MVTHIIYLWKEVPFYRNSFKTETAQTSLDMTQNYNHFQCREVIGQGQVWSHVFKIYETRESSLKHCR